jgi:hypothetical protein
MLALVVFLLLTGLSAKEQQDNLNGCETVKQGMHYELDDVLPGLNEQLDWQVNATLDLSCATYICNCSEGCQQGVRVQSSLCFSRNVLSADWNKLWGKVRHIQLPCISLMLAFSM